MHSIHVATRLMLAALVVIALPAMAQVTVTNAWVRGTVAGQTTTGAFMELKAPADMTLVAVASPSAAVVEIHEMKMDGGMMKMRAVEKIALPAGKTVELKAGGYHVMLVNLAKPLKEGESVPLKLTFEDRAGKRVTQEVSATVRSLTGGVPPAKH